MNRLKLSIFFFSGSGNTEFVTSLFFASLSNKFDVKVIDIDKVMRDLETFDINFDKAGLIYPVHALNAPKNVLKFLKDRLPEATDKSFFVIKSPGDPFFNGGATHEIRKILFEKGYSIDQEGTIVMPANVFLKYREPFIKKILKTAKTRVIKFSDHILSDEKVLHKNPFWLRFSTWLFSRLESLGSPIFGKDLSVNNNCNSCGLCENICPAGNIEIVDGKPEFGWKCLICMRCIYKCPQNAISPRIFRFFKVKNYYNINKFKDIPQKTSEFIPSLFEKGFQRYFDEL